jgi:hypothetical protein
MIAIILFLGLAGEPNLKVLVEAIEHAENTPWSYPGGGLQFTAAAWGEETKLPYRYAKEKPHAKAIAVQRLERYARQLRARGIQPTPRLLGTVWNKGYTGALRIHRDGTHCEYGERVENLFHDLRKP